MTAAVTNPENATSETLSSETVSGGHPAPGPVSRLLLRLIAVYQLIRGGKPSPCRFVPSCSDYAVESIEHHGAWWGGWLAVRRIGRCRPWGGHGVDLVPERKEGR